jgi:hypothetical protein
VCSHCCAFIDSDEYSNCRSHISALRATDSAALRATDCAADRATDCAADWAADWTANRCAYVAAFDTVVDSYGTTYVGAII